MARLSYSGSTGDLQKKLFPRGFAGEVMGLILKTWGGFSVPTGVCHETPITALFHKALVSAYADSGRSWFITLEDPITDPDSGTQDGRNDLRFYPLNHPGQTIFFAVECKRLHVTTDSGFSCLADKYVDEGVRRFVDGKYSTGLPCGGMVGYVMDNQMDKALESVLKEIRTKEQALGLPVRTGVHTPSSALQNHRWSIDSRHHRSNHQFTLHHVLLGIRARQIRARQMP